MIQKYKAGDVVSIKLASDDAYSFNKDYLSYISPDQIISHTPAKKSALEEARDILCADWFVDGQPNFAMLVVAMKFVLDHLEEKERE
jgi:hypothetical protein